MMCPRLLYVVNRERGVKMGYVIFQDLADATETKIHKESCLRFLSRKRNAATVRWHGPYDGFEEARRVAESLAVAKRHGVNPRPSCCW